MLTRRFDSQKLARALDNVLGPDRRPVELRKVPLRSEGDATTANNQRRSALVDRDLVGVLAGTVSRVEEDRTEKVAIGRSGVVDCDD
jgi:hypothetical protein